MYALYSFHNTILGNVKISENYLRLMWLESLPIARATSDSSFDATFEAAAEWLL